MTMEQIIKLHEGTKKLRQFTTADFDKVTDQFHGLSTLMGLKEITPQECAFMVDFVKKEFPDFSFSEIKEAFSMNLAGKLEKKVEPYGAFNLNYVSSILVEYRKLRRKIISRQKPEPIVKSEEQKKREYDKMIEEVFAELSERFKSKRYGFTYSEGIMYYDCLKHFGMMPDYKDQELWEQSKKQALEILMGSTDKDSRTIISSFKDAGVQLDSRLFNRKKAMIINTYKGHLLKKFLEESELFDTLEDARDTLKK